MDRCEICKEDIGEVIVLLHKKGANGKLDSLVCLKCAEESGLYCSLHNQPHQGYNDGSHSCHRCAQELVMENRHRAAVYMSLIEAAAPKDYALLRMEQTFSYQSENLKDEQLLYFLAKFALAHNMELDVLVQNLVVARSLDSLKR